MSRAFVYRIGQHVRFIGRDICGEIVGRHSNIDDKHSYNVRYVDDKGDEVEEWWTEDSIYSV